MAEVVTRYWQGNTQSGISRRDRQSCEYKVYIPDRLVGRPVVLEGSVAADVSEAEMGVARLNLEARGLSNSEALARLLLRGESVASSKIEGLEVGAGRLLSRNPPLSLMNDSRCSFDRGQGSPVLAVRVLWHVGWL